MTAKRLIVRGLVQGVGYRANFALQAQGLGLRGWVRNRLDGSVEAVVDGEDQAVEHILSWARKGPRPARVDALLVSDCDENPGDEFEVRPTA